MKCQPIKVKTEIPPFRGYHAFDGKYIITSNSKIWKGDIFTKEVVESANAKFKKLTLIDGKTNKPIMQKVKEILNLVSFKGNGEESKRILKPKEAL